MTHEPPYLTLPAPHSLRGLVVLLAFSFPALAAACFLLWIEVAANAPWPPISPRLLTALVLLWFLSSLALAATTIRVAERFLAARAGDIAFSDAGVLVRKPGRAWHVFPWSEIDSYDDGAADFVQLHVRGARRRRDPDAALPTSGTDARTVVLAELDRRGLRRAG